MDQILFYILIFTILGLVGVIIMFLVAYLRLNTKLLDLSRQNVLLKQDSSVNAEHELAEAHRKALLIIEEANKKAAAMIQEVKSMDQTSTATMEQKMNEVASQHANALKSASEELLTLYKETLEKIKEDEMQSAKSISKDVTSITSQQLGQFKDILARETIASEKLVQGKINSEYQAIEHDLQAYRQKRLAEIDRNILQIIQSVTEVILKKQLSVSDQEQLVYEALNSLKQQTKL